MLLSLRTLGIWGHYVPDPGKKVRWKNVRYLLKNTEAKWILLIPLILYIMTVYMIMHP